jgi:cystathionine beta-lyase/cystathionine gamma-synthase
MAPQVAWLILRGTQTLALRLTQHNANAYALANMLQSHAKVKDVFYPGLEDHPSHNIAQKQMTGYGGMISFDVEDFEKGRLLTNSVELCSLATSLGGVETIIQHSASMTNGNLTPEERKLAGISEGLIRLSVGIEDADDIFADLENALSKI